MKTSPNDSQRSRYDEAIAIAEAAVPLVVWGEKRGELRERLDALKQSAASEKQPYAKHDAASDVSRMDGHNDKRGEVDFLHVLRETRAQGDPVTISPRTLTWFTKLGRLHERDTIEFVSGIERELEAALSAQSSERATMGEQIAQDAARDLDNVAAKIMTGRNMAEEEARIVTRGARMLERLSAASARLPSMICPRCEVDRLKTACPNRVGCPMVGDSRGPG